MFILMSQMCTICMQNAKQLGLPMDSPDLPIHDGCLRNHNGTSKSMEALACVEGFQRIYDKTGTAVYGLVGDDDSSFRANIRHNWKEKVKSPLHPNFTEKDIPRRIVQKGKLKGKSVKKDDHGKLRLDVPEVVEDYCDPNH